MKIPTGERLKDLAGKLGVPIITSVSRTEIPAVEAEIDLQQRVMEAQRHIREHRLWLVAVLSMIIAVVSAVAAWVTVYRSTCASDRPVTQISGDKE